jgi:hypothetical protein
MSAPIIWVSYWFMRSGVASAGEEINPSDNKKAIIVTIVLNFLNFNLKLVGTDKKKGNNLQ